MFNNVGLVTIVYMKFRLIFKFYKIMQKNLIKTSSYTVHLMIDFIERLIYRDMINLIFSTHSHRVTFSLSTILIRLNIFLKCTFDKCPYLGIN